MQADDTALAMATSNAIKEPGRTAGVVPLALLWGLALLLGAVDLADGVAFVGDIDDRMRALQIRDLLADGAWYDRTLPAISMPEAYVSPWSRLVDLPYVLIARGLAPLVGIETGIAAAMLVWPPVMLAGFCALSLVVIRSVCGLAPSVLWLAAAALAMTYALWEFVPGRIDHHNVQLVLLMAMLAGLCRPGTRGGVLAGAAACLSVAVGLEVVALIAASFGVCAVAAAAGNAGARKHAWAAGIAMTAAAPLFGLLLAGPAMLGVECDSWSAPWITATASGGLMLAATGSRLLAELSVAARFGAVGAGAILLVAGLALAFPSCLAGPYAMIDEASRAFWLDRVAQEKSVLFLFADGRYGMVAMLGLAAFILLASISRVSATVRSGDHRAALVWAVAVAGLILTLWQIRFFRFALAFAPLFLPWLMAAIGRRDGGLGSAPTILAGVVALALVGIGLLTVPARERRYDAVDIMSADECEGADFSVLSMLAPGKIMAPLGLSMPIAESASGHSVAALPYHRAAPGIRRMAQAFTTREADVRRKALAPFDYVAVCARPLPNELDGAPLYLALAGGKSWPGLADVGDKSNNGLRILRIDHEALR